MKEPQTKERKILFQISVFLYQLKKNRNSVLFKVLFFHSFFQFKSIFLNNFRIFLPVNLRHKHFIRLCVYFTTSIKGLIDNKQFTCFCMFCDCNDIIIFSFKMSFKISFKMKILNYFDTFC